MRPPRLQTFVHGADGLRLQLLRGAALAAQQFLKHASAEHGGYSPILSHDRGHPVQFRHRGADELRDFGVVLELRRGRFRQLALQGIQDFCQNGGGARRGSTEG